MVISFQPQRRSSQAQSHHLLITELLFWRIWNPTQPEKLEQMVAHKLQCYKMLLRGKIWTQNVCAPQNLDPSGRSDSTNWHTTNISAGLAHRERHVSGLRRRFSVADYALGSILIVLFCRVAGPNSGASDFKIWKPAFRLHLWHNFSKDHPDKTRSGNFNN